MKEIRTAVPAGYAEFLADLKRRIRTAQLQASLAVNRELVLLYWAIGREILARQREDGWGTGVIERLARDLRSAFPGMQGLSPRNLGYMKAFAEAWPEERILQQVVAKLPWGHNVRLLDMVKDSGERTTKIILRGRTRFWSPIAITRSPKRLRPIIVNWWLGKLASTP